MVFSCIRRRNLSFSCSSSRRRRRANRQSSSSYCNSRALATPSSAWIIGFDRFFGIGVGGLGLGLFFSAAAPRHSRTRQCRQTIANWRSRFDAMPTNHGQLEPILRRRQWANFHGRACLGLAWCWSLPWVALTWTVVIMPPGPAPLLRKTTATTIELVCQIFTNIHEPISAFLLVKDLRLIKHRFCDQQPIQSPC